MLNVNMNQQPTLFLHNSVSTFKISLLLDSGSMISIVKKSVISEEAVWVNEGHKTINGLSKNPIETKGEIDMELYFPSFTISHVFYVMNDDDVQLQHSGILGSDFLRKYETNLDLSKNEFSLKCDLKRDVISLNLDKVLLPKFSERTVTFVNLREQTGVIEEPYIIEDDVIIPPCMVDSVENQATVLVINKKDHEVMIENIDPKIISIDEYEFPITENHDVQEFLNLAVIDHMSTDIQERVKELILEFSDVFFEYSNVLTTTDLIEAEIKLIDNSKVLFTKQPPLGIHLQEAMRELIRTYLDLGIISESTSLYNSPVYLIKKKSQPGEEAHSKFRLITDFRKLNQNTVMHHYTVPDINMILAEIKQAEWFTSIDLKLAFHQIKIKEEDRSKTAFTVYNMGRFQWNRMLMGLSLSPFYQSRLLEKIFHDPQREDLPVQAFIDDILISSNDIESHFIILRKVFERLREANLKVCLNKTKWFKKSISYLGFQISHNRLDIADEFKQSILEIKPPRTVRQLQQFLGKANYLSRFIEHFQIKVKPLTDLLRKDVDFGFSEIQLSCFENIKREIVNLQKLSLIDPDKQFYLQSDASGIGIGAHIGQITKPRTPPIAYASRTLTKSEKNYNTVELEALSACTHMKKFRYYLLNKEFKLLTDCAPLLQILGSKTLTNIRLLKMSLSVAEFKFKIEHVQGRKNIIADFLSRNPREIDPNDQIITEVSDDGLPFVGAVTRAQKKKEADKEKTVVTSSEKKKTNESENEKRFNGQKFEKLFGNKELRKKFENDLIHEIATSALDSNKSILIMKLPMKMLKADVLLIEKESGLKIELANESLVKIGLPAIPNTVAKKFGIYILTMALIEMNETTKDKKVAVQFTAMNETDLLFLRLCWSKMSQEGQILLIVNNKLRFVTEEKEIKEILEVFHNSSFGTHVGGRRLYQLLKQSVIFKNMYAKIKKMCRKCLLCAMSKTVKGIKQPAVMPNCPRTPWQVLQYDAVGPFTPTPTVPAYTNVLTIVDVFSRFLILAPVTDLSTESVAKAFVEHVVLPYGTPAQINSDNATCFRSKLMMQIMKILGITPKFGIAYHPKSQGCVESKQKIIKSIMRIAILKKQPENEWLSLLPFAASAYNRTPHVALGNVSPYEMLYARKYPMLTEVFESQKILNSTYGQYVQDLGQSLIYSWQIAREYDERMKMATKKQHDKSLREVQMSPGDLIVIAVPKNLQKSLGNKYQGPYEIIKEFENYVEYKKGNKLIKCNKDRVKLVDKADDSE